MKLRIQLATVVIVTITIICAPGCTNIKKEGLILSGGEPVAYLCENGDQIMARYYSLSDDSLNFVKVSMPDSMEYTLPRVGSASGARYTDDLRLVWWTKGDIAFAQIPIRGGEWRIKHRNCRKVSKNE